jgi:hypothetical protein
MFAGRLFDLGIVKDNSKNCFDFPRGKALGQII